MTSDPRTDPSVFEKIVQAIMVKLTASKAEVTKSKRIRVTAHKAASGKIEVELETKH